MHFDKIIIKRKNINAQDKAETFFFYMASWFLSEMRTLQDIYICSMNTKDASGLEVYGRNYRTMTIGCILCAKLWEGWQILQNCYFSQEMHKQFESLYSNEGKASLVALKKYFANGKKTIVYKIRNSTFHYPKTEDEKIN